MSKQNCVNVFSFDVLDFSFFVTLIVSAFTIDIRSEFNISKRHCIFFLLYLFYIDFITFKIQSMPPSIFFKRVIEVNLCYFSKAFLKAFEKFLCHSKLLFLLQCNYTIYGIN